MKKQLLLSFVISLLVLTGCKKNDDLENETVVEVVKDAPFVSVWKVSEDDMKIVIPGTIGDEGILVDWGEENSTPQKIAQGATLEHTYAKEGEYTVSIIGKLTDFYFFDTDKWKIIGTPSYLLAINSWGNLELGTKGYQFYGCSILTTLPLNTPVNWTKITSMRYMFATFDDNATVFNQDISGWDVSNVTNMRYMFANASAFNQNISKWDVSKVTNMSYMFYRASAFDKNISKWDVSNVTNMEGMFFQASAFNQDISAWDVSKVTNMGLMFIFAFAFNQDIGGWDVSKVTDMGLMFYSASTFNRDISGWDVNNVTDMSHMFWSAYAFNQNISTWDVSKVIDYQYFYSGSGLNLNHIPSKFK